MTTEISQRVSAAWGTGRDAVECCVTVHCLPALMFVDTPVCVLHAGCLNDN